MARKKKEKSIKKRKDGEHIIVAPDTLKPHPRNYRVHLDDQLEHIMKSIQEHGIYRNVVVARDDTILAGHGVVAAAKKMKLKKIPVIRLDVDPLDPLALKVLTGDNEIANLVEVDDRMLSELLKEIKDVNVDSLLGTGYDERMLANLIMVTRPASEIKDFDAAAEWVGMPEYDTDRRKNVLKIEVWFRTKADRLEFVKTLNLKVPDKIRCSSWWPQRENDDVSSVRFVED